MTHIWSEEKHGTTRDRRPLTDDYPTPVECFEALAPHIVDFPTDVWEPACGNGLLAEAMKSHGYCVLSSDIACGQDFLLAKNAAAPAIITNPRVAGYSINIRRVTLTRSRGDRTSRAVAVHFLTWLGTYGDLERRRRNFPFCGGLNDHAVAG